MLLFGDIRLRGPGAHREDCLAGAPGQRAAGSLEEVEFEVDAPAGKGERPGRGRSVDKSRRHEGLSSNGRIWKYCQGQIVL